MSQINRGSASSHRSHRPNGGLPRRKVRPHHGPQHPSGSSDGNQHEHSSQRNNKSFNFNESQWFDSPISVGDTEDYSPEDLVPLPFDGKDDTSPFIPSGHHHDRHATNSTSDCISICSDQAVICPSATNDAIDDDVPSSFHSDVTTTLEPHRISICSDQAVIICASATNDAIDDDVHSSFHSDVTTTLEPHQEDNRMEESEEDSFDPNIMPAPPTNLLRQPQHHFHRLSQSICLAEYTLGQEGRPIHMKVESTHQSAQLAVASLLRQFDAVFIKRSDGRFCYAILAEKIIEKDVELSKLRFVVDSDGSTKNFRFHKWGQCVRLIRAPMEANALL